jgi:hypothetical protein
VAYNKFLLYTRNKKMNYFFNANKNMNFHRYVINIHNFNPKPTCDLHAHLEGGGWYFDL